MNKYMSWVGIIPITIILMGFLTEDDLSKHTEQTCVGLLLSLIVFITLYFMLLYGKLKKWVALIFGTVLWCIAFLIKKHMYK